MLWKNIANDQLLSAYVYSVVRITFKFWLNCRISGHFEAIPL